jgi:hypothetical protein
MAWSSGNRAPALGPRFTTSNAEPCGAPSAPKSWPAAPAVAAASCSLSSATPFPAALPLNVLWLQVNMGVGAQCAVVSTTRKRAWLVTIR